MNSFQIPHFSPATAAPQSTGMSLFLSRFQSFMAIALATLLSVHASHAGVTVVRQYRMGDGQTEAVSDGATSSAIDIATQTSIPAIGTPIYTTHVAPRASERCGSQLAVVLDGGFQAFASLDNPPLPEDRFGLELWVQPSVLPEGFSILIYNGNTTQDGYGIYLNGGKYGVSYGGIGRFGEADATVGEWIHLALVVENGHSTFYANGIAAGQTDLQFLPPSGGFAIGAHPQPPLGEHFAGALDEVRLFTFDTAPFVVQDLEYYQKAVTRAATDVTGVEATLHGVVRPENESVWAWFEWSATPDQVFHSTPQFIAANSNPIELEASIAALDGNISYSGSLVVSNEAGIFKAPPLPFKTLPWVTTLADHGPSSLRQCIAAVGASGEIRIAVPGSIPLGGIPLVITNEIVIRGMGAEITTFDGEGTSRVIEVASEAVLEAHGITIRRGKAPNGEPPNILTFSPEKPAGHGGGIENYGTTTLYQCVLEKNSAGHGKSGGILFSTTPQDGGGGGAIHNKGIMHLEQCLLKNNSGGQGGAGTPPIAGAAEAGGKGGVGGAIWNEGILTLVTVSLIENQAGTGGNGTEGNTQYASSPFGGGGGPGGIGGAIANKGQCKLLQCTLSRNQAGAGGIRGAGILGGPPGGAGFANAILNLKDLEIVASTVVSNFMPHSLGGGGIYASETSPNTSIRSSILALNGGPLDLEGPFESLGYNLIGISPTNAFTAPNGLATDLLGERDHPLDPTLGPLTADKVWCVTHPVLPGSLAIGAGDDTLLTSPYSLAQDACGNPRKSGQHLEIGAREIHFFTQTTTIKTEAPILIPSDDGTGSWTGTLPCTLIVQGIPTQFGIDFGLTTLYGRTFFSNSPPVRDYVGTIAAAVRGLIPGRTYHYRGWAVNELGKMVTEDRPFTIPSSGNPGILGDRNGDGSVNSEELSEVLSNYWGAKAWLQWTNVAGLGESQVTFDLPELMQSPFQVQSSTNLVDWESLGLAIPRFEFTDTNAPALPRRFYRLQTR